MKYPIVALALISLIFGSCSPQPAPITATLINSTETPSTTPTQTRLPTRTPQPTRTPTATFLPEHALATSLNMIGTSLPETKEKITSDNVYNISLLGSWGQGVLSDIAYSPDGNILAISTTAGVAVYDANDLSKREFFLDALVAVDRLAFHPNSSLLAVASNDPPKIQIWELADRTIKKEIVISGPQFGTYIKQIEFSPDGKNFGAAISKGWTQNEIIIWQVDEKWDVAHKAIDYDNFAFSPNGDVLLVAELNASLYDINDWKPQKKFPVEKATNAIFSEDGKKIIFSAKWGQVIDVYNSESGNLDYRIDEIDIFRPDQFQRACDDPFIGYDPPEYMPPSIRRIILTRQGNAFAVNYDYDGSRLSAVRTYNLSDGAFIDEYYGDDIKGFDFAPNREFLALNMRRIGSVHIWNTGNDELARTIHTFNTPAFDARFSPDGKWLAIMYGDSTRIRQIKNGEMLRSANAVVAFSPSSELLALGATDGAITLENLSGTIKANLVNEHEWFHDLIYSPDGKWVISTTNECNIRIWQATDGTFVKQLESPTTTGMMVESTRVAVPKLLISPDGRYLLGGDEFGAITIWSLPDGAILQRLYSKEDDPNGLDMALSSNGTTLAIALIGSVQIYDVVSNQFQVDIPIPSNKDYAYTVTAVAFSNDGNLLAAGLDDGSIYIFRTQDFKPIFHFQAHHHVDFEGVLGLTFSPDDRLLVSTGWDGKVKLWGITP